MCLTSLILLKIKRNVLKFGIKEGSTTVVHGSNELC